MGQLFVGKRTGGGMKATKVPRLLRFKFLKGIEEGLASLTPQKILEARPTNPIPQGAIIVGTLSEEYKALHALTRLLEACRASAEDDCVVERAQGRMPRYDALLAWTDLARTTDDLFWTCVRVEMPVPPSLAYEQGLATAIGPDYEVYYYIITAEEVVEGTLPHMMQDIEVPRVLH